MTDNRTPEPERSVEARPDIEARLATLEGAVVQVKAAIMKISNAFTVRANLQDSLNFKMADLAGGIQFVAKAVDEDRAALQMLADAINKIGPGASTGNERPRKGAEVQRDELGRITGIRYIY
ncbi:MAG: hypothetical protein AB7P08_10400 [Burkholderiales bacterium]